MIYNKKLFPHIHHYVMLGQDTEQGIRYARDNASIINGEFIKVFKIESHRDTLGGEKKIHMPETDHNPPTPFFGDRPRPTSSERISPIVETI